MADAAENLPDDGDKKKKGAHKIHLVDGETRIFIHVAGKRKIIVPFGDDNQEAAVDHFKLLAEALDGFAVRDGAKPGWFENQQGPIICLTVTLLAGALLLSSLSEEEYDYQGRRSGIGRMIFDLAHSQYPSAQINGAMQKEPKILLGKR